MVRRVAPAAALLLAFIALWQALAGLAAVDDLLLASPVEVARALAEDRALLAANTSVTFIEVVLGLAVAVAAGGVAAVLMHLIRPLGDAASPLLVASQAIPIPILAPLFVLAFDYGLAPKLAIVALISFFPVTIGLLFGMRSVDPGVRKLMRSLGASRTAVLAKVELPAALPAFFSGLRIAATISVIGAVFGEWAGADRGLGRLVLLANNQLQTPRVYAGVVVLTVMAVALYAAVAAAERLVVPWARTEAVGP